MANRVVFPFTQREVFESLIALVSDGDMVYDHMGKNGDKETVHPDPEKVVEFLTHKIAQLDKQADTPKKLTPQQVKNEGVKEQILTAMEDGVNYTITDMLAQFGFFAPNTTPQYVSAMITQLREAGKIERIVEHNRALFHKVNSDMVED